jgi:hypothetical protein
LHFVVVASVVGRLALTYLVDEGICVDADVNDLEGIVDVAKNVLTKCDDFCFGEGEDLLKNKNIVIGVNELQTFGINS